MSGGWRRQFEDDAPCVWLSGEDREEFKRLRKEVFQPRMERDLIKSQPFFRQGNEMKYGFIRDHANDYPVKLLRRMLSVQRSGYYDWRDRPGKVVGPEELERRRRMKSPFRHLCARMQGRSLRRILR